MRFLIAFSLWFCFCAPAISAKGVKTDFAVQKIDSQPSVSSKKTKHAINIEFFSGKFDCLHSIIKNHTVATPNFTRQYLAIQMWTALNFHFSAVADCCYTVPFQQLYPKHNFW
ncbi:MAG: hypothetical protein V4541_10085 [Bacteroidota bacterium]